MEKSLIDKDIPDAFKFLLSEISDYSTHVAVISNKSAIVEELARKYGCVASESVVKDRVKKNITEFLSGNAVNKSGFRKFEKYIAVSYYAGDSSFKNVFFLLCFLRAVVNELNNYSVEPSDWLSAKSELENLLPLTNLTEDSVAALYASAKILGEAVKFFRDKGFTINVNIDGIRVPPRENDRLIAFFKNDYQK